MNKITITTKYDKEDKCYYAHIKETNTFGDGENEYKAVLDAIHVYFDILDWNKEDEVNGVEILLNNKTRLGRFLFRANAHVDNYGFYYFLASVIFMITIGQFWEYSILIQILLFIPFLLPLSYLAILLLELINWIYKKARFKING